ncbi:MAG: signal peptidase I [Clostridium sp. 26_21]|nr:MAG: signal peptidase I [Clostridium sp. 26_21]
MKDKKGKIGNIIGYILGYILDLLLILITILIIIGIYYITQIKILKNEYANIFGYTFFEVATGSMSNTIEIGDVVIVKVTKDVEKNEIIVYKDGNNFVTHRLIENNGEKLVAKGDANNSEDKPITKEQILGRVICIIPKLGIWRKIFLSPEIIGLILIFMVLLGIVLQITSNNSDKVEEKK